MKTIKKIVIAAMLITIANPSIAGEIKRNVQLVEVASHAFPGEKSFGVLTNATSGLCAGVSQWIVFNEEKFASLESYNQSFSLALTALTTGQNVRIHNYTDNSCDGADFISISR